jgi:hypothetical protein
VPEASWRPLSRIHADVVLLSEQGAKISISGPIAFRQWRPGLRGDATSATLYDV